MKTILALFICAFSFVGASEKLYFDINEVPKSDDAFHIQVGANEWVRTKSIHRDESGFFTFYHNIATTFTPTGVEMAKEWKCPYCNLFWPWGSPCGNPNCPGKFR